MAGRFPDLSGREEEFLHDSMRLLEDGTEAREEQSLPPWPRAGAWRLTAAGLALAAAATSVCMLARAGLSSGKALLIKDPSSLALQSKYQNLDVWLYNGESVQTGAARSAEVPQAPQEDMHDGNKCGDDEELFDSLCYAKCSLLTQGSHPIRTSSFSCCTSHPCGMGNTRFNMRPCSGFDVAGDINGETGACPHAVGTCLQDEELLLGVCYKQCAILTNGQFKHRLAATTCCSATGLGCLNPSNLRTDFVNFPVGGGKGDGNTATPAAIHMPMTALTEKGAAAKAEAAGSVGAPVSSPVR